LHQSAQTLRIGWAVDAIVIDPAPLLTQIERYDAFG
jgi:hypothetical protein